MLPVLPLSRIGILASAILRGLRMAFDIEAARRNLLHREKDRKRQLDSLYERAVSDFDMIVSHLISTYDPTHIYQWGSLLHRKRFREWSDIDIALEGLSHPLAGLRAASDAQEMTDLPVDLVELERIHPLHAQTIRSDGRLVYERE